VARLGHRGRETHPLLLGDFVVSRMSYDVTLSILQSQFQQGPFKLQKQQVRSRLVVVRSADVLFLQSYFLSWIFYFPLKWCVWNSVIISDRIA